MNTKIFTLSYVILVVAVKTIACARKISSLCRGNSTNCSQLIENEERCYMYRHTECLVFDFNRWTNQSIANVTTEKDAGFDVTIFAYKNIRPAYNVTITHSLPGAEGFFMQLEEVEGNYNSCRIFDFRNPESSLRIPFHMYYDCYNQLNKDSIYKYLLTVRSLPYNKQLVYEVNVPFIVNDEIGCDSETLIIALVNSVHENKIAIKFQKVSSKFNVLQYKIKLIRTKPSGFSKIKTLSANPTDDKRMISVTFENLNRGIYNLSVEPLHKEGRKCRTTSVLLPITKELPNYGYVGWLIGGIIFVLLASGVAYYVISKKLASILKPMSRKILIVYHPDNSALVNFVRCLTSYLENFIPAIVFVDCKLVNEDAAVWIVDSFKSSDIIMIILSNGITTGIIDMPVPPPYNSLFRHTYNHIYHEIIMNEESQSKIYIKVYFENYDFSNIPEDLKLTELGPNYKLMKDFKKVFCRLKGVSSFWSLFIQLPNTGREEIDAALLELIEQH